MIASANPWIIFLESVSVGRSVSEMRSLSYVPALLIYYSFDLDRYRVEDCIQHWLDRFRGDWLRLAIVEALYQGRYKIISIEQILNLWARRGQPICHFNHEFEKIVCSKLPEELLPLDYLNLTLEMRPSVPELLPQVEEQEERFLDRVSDESGLEQNLPTLTDSIIEEVDVEEEEKSMNSESEDPAIALELDSDGVNGRSDQLPIDRFAPRLPTSEFYLKLQAFAQDSPS
ncbi:hypothetical protein PN466_20100 [Roseofilum reptotaenium CS-1145]|nr:hypothetical protein [Roseofilum reptotaenium]MDB9519253.1 hypothetical protein [Roseofilum reptotaenium CS-1145]